MLPASFTTKQKDVARPSKINSTDTQEGKWFVKWAACLVGFIVPYASCSNTIHRDNHTRKVRKHSAGQQQWTNYRTMQVAHCLWCGLWVVLAVLLRASLTHSRTTIRNLLLFPGLFWPYGSGLQCEMRVLSRYLESGEERQVAILWRQLQADVWTNAQLTKASGWVFQNHQLRFNHWQWTGKRKVRGHHWCSHLQK